MPTHLSYIFIYVTSSGGSFKNGKTIGEVTKGSLGYLSSMCFSTSLVLGEVVGPFLEIDGWK